ncbi:hypothetical protein [Spiroplasma clarkii]|uniref:hypothetical protein n=1 Tax=Spiroplasma clarkii TaxID=2139 RepID=UPI0011BA5D75|nr:hypothetical protein [Spiroplasma clarkii]
MANNQLFSKTIWFKDNGSNLVHIKFHDFVKGDTSIMGFFERHILSVYIKRQVIAFNVQVLKAKLRLNLYNEKSANAVNRKITRMLEYSKQLY